MAKISPPEEMRAYRQWVCHDTAKRPINPHTGKLASVADPSTWGTYEEALAANCGVGVGFVFTENDPFFGIDLDVAEGSKASTGQQKIYDAFDSYSELSPSGRGLHIICKGTVPGAGVRNSGLGVEIYSSGRFFTFTGDVVRNVPIVEQQEKLDQLCGEIGQQKYTSQQATLRNASPTVKMDDADLIEKLKRSPRNRAYFDNKDISDWSVAYHAVLHALCFLSSDEQQIRRIVEASPLVTQAAPHGRESRSDRVGRLWVNEYARAADRGDQERQERANTIEHGKQMAKTMKVNGKTLAEWIETWKTTPLWFPASSLAGKPVPPRRWHVPGMIPSGTVTLLSGDGGAGKSLIALQLAVATACDTTWLRQAVNVGNAIYISAEDDTDEIHRRLTAIGDVGKMGRLTLLSLAGENALLSAPFDRSGVLQQTSLFEAIDARIGTERPALLVLDTLADFFGGNENDRAQARQFIGMLRGLAIRHECAVLLLSHPSVSGMATGTGTSGSTAWNNSVRSRLYLSRVMDSAGNEPSPDNRVLRTKKANYGRSGGEIAMLWHNGIFLGVDVPTGAEMTAKAKSIFVKLLGQLTEQGRRVNASGGQTYAPRVFAAHPESEGITKRAFKNAMEKLLADSRVVMVETGPPSKRRNHLEVKSDEPTLFHPENQPFQPPSNPSPNPITNPVPTGGVPTPHTP